MIERCKDCPINPDIACCGLIEICERVHNPDFAAAFVARHPTYNVTFTPETDVERAARLIAQYPPRDQVGTGCGGCGKASSSPSDQT